MPKAWSTTNRGMSLVEVILASSLFALLLTALVGAYLYGEESTALSGNRARAAALVGEGLEAVRSLRDAGFANLTDGTYGLSTTSNQWNLSGSSDTSGIFTRQVTIATIDTKRKSVTAQVTWQQNAQRSGSISLSTRLTNWIATGIGDWSTPITQASLNLSGNQNGVKIQVSGNYAYVVRNAGSPNFFVIDISTPASPSTVGSLTLNGTLSNIFVSGSYAYVTSNDNAQELQIVNITSPASPSLTGSVNNSGSANGTGVYVVGTTAYVTFDDNNEFSIVDVSTPASPSILSSLNLTSDANEVVVSGNYAYIASDNNSEELQVINVSNPLSPSQVASLNASGNSNADTIAIAGSLIFLGQGSSFHVIDISTPTSPSTLGSVGTSGNVNDIALNLGNSNTYVYLGTSDNSVEFQVINVTTPSSPSLLGSINSTGNDNINGLAYDSTLDRAFAVGDRDSDELWVFAPQ